MEITTGEKVNLRFSASVSLKNYCVLTKNNFNQYVAIVSLLTANSFIILIVQYLFHFFHHGKLDFLIKELVEN